MTVMVVIAFIQNWKVKWEADSDAISGGGILKSECHGWNFGRGGGERKFEVWG